MRQKKLSLQEQLLQAGLASAAKAKQIKSEKSKEAKLQKHNNVPIVDNAALLAQKAKQEQLAKDRELNALQKQQAEQKAITAQIKQLIELNRKPQDQEDGIPYRFNDNNKIKTLYVNETTRQQLINGKLAVVRLDKRYDLVAADIAEKIKLRDASCVIVLNTIEDKRTDDPYAAYQVPDDLVW